MSYRIGRMFAALRELGTDLRGLAAGVGAELRDLAAGMARDFAALAREMAGRGDYR